MEKSTKLQSNNYNKIVAFIFGTIGSLFIICALYIKYHSNYKYLLDELVKPYYVKKFSHGKCKYTYT